MRNITIFSKFINDVEQTTLTEMLDCIKRCVYKREIDNLRAMLAQGDQKGYDHYKRDLPAFTTSGKFVGGRKLPFLEKYSGVIVLDLDKMTADILQSVKAVIMLCTYTLACFVSPSGNGLKVLVCVSTGPEDHLNAYLSLQRFYSVLAGVEIDPSGKDINRLCFVSADQDLYYNPDATVFEPLSGAGQLWPATIPEGPFGKRATPAGKSTDTVDINKLYHRAIANVERYHSFVEGQRNEFDFALALQMRKLGLSEATTTQFMLQDYNFNDQEVHACIKSAYGYNLSAKPKGKKKVMLQSIKTDLQTAAPPDEPPSGNKKKSGRDLYDIHDVEWMLKKWFDTRFNLVTGVVEWRIAGTGEPFIWLEDKHEHSMFRKLHNEEQMIPISTLHILLHSDFSPDFNPFRDYFSHLKKWNGKTDYIGQLCDTVKTEDDVYWEYSFRKWFVAYVASMLVEEIINHTVVVLIGSQGVGKTSWMKKLVPPILLAYLGTTAMQIDSKDAAIQLSECGLIILDELENLNRKDLAAFKEMITRPKSRIRRPYGRNSECMPHTATFIAGVNFEQILTDISGSRRYLCSNIISIDYLHNVDIDGCMAQAYALFRSGFIYWFDQNEIKQLTRHNEDFLSKSVEEELISTWFVKVTREEWDTKSQFMNSQNYLLMTTTQIAVKIMEKARFNLMDSTIVKIGKILKKMGFERIRKGNNYSYMLRILDSEVVEKASRNLEETPEQITEREGNEQLIRFEEDLFTASGEDGLPF